MGHGSHGHGLVEIKMIQRCFVWCPVSIHDSYHLISSHQISYPNGSKGYPNGSKAYPNGSKGLPAKPGSTHLILLTAGRIFEGFGGGRLTDPGTT